MLTLPSRVSVSLAIRRVCDSAGHCSDADGEATFRMTPMQLEAGGRGSYTLSYGTTETEMFAQSEIGPFYWRLEGESNSLMPSSESEWLWHQLILDGTPSARIRFLECSFRQ